MFLQTAHKHLLYTKTLDLSSDFYDISLEHLRPKWQKSQLRDLEVLQSEWDANYRAAKKCSDDQMNHCHLDSDENHPQNIQDDRTEAVIIADTLPEWKERQPCELEALQANRYSDYRDTPQTAYDKPHDPG